MIGFISGLMFVCGAFGGVPFLAGVIMQMGETNA